MVHTQKSGMQIFFILKLLITYMTNFQHGANPRVCLAVVQQDSYDGLNTLVEYYQMVSHCNETPGTLFVYLSLFNSN